MATVNIHDAKTHLSRLLERVQRGEEITLAKAGVPIAKLVPLSVPKRKLGFLVATGVIDSTELQAPLDGDELAAWERGAL